MEKNYFDDISLLIKEYDHSIRNIDKNAKNSDDRAYGGVIRSVKGELVEKLAKKLIEIAWKSLGMDPDRLSFEKRSIKIPIKKEYVERVKNPDVKKYIIDNISKYVYPLKTDIHVHVDRKFKIAVECKAYTENAMLKRVLVDFTLLKQVFPNLTFVLFQLESQLGGDYSTANHIKYGSYSTHTLLSYFDIDLNIITLLEGERKVDKPIHQQKHYKPLKEESLKAGIEVFKDLLR